MTEVATGRVLLVRSKPVRVTESGQVLLRLARQVDLLTADVARELGFIPLRAPALPAQVAARTLSRLPLPGAAQWVEAGSHPAVMDTTKAKEQLGWTPRFTGLEALRATIDQG